LFALVLALAAAPPPDPVALDRLLGQIVHGESVDYVALARDGRAAIVGYLDELATIDPAALPRTDRIAFYLNLYNATVLRAVIERYRPGYRADADSFRLFDEPLVRCAGRTMSLNDLEHRVLRPLGEPRIHAALVCAARSCPPLASRAYRGADLVATLEERMRRFVQDRGRNEIDVAHKTLRLSRIFEWYAEEFGGKEGVARYVGRYAGVDATSFRVEFLPYSWELNELPTVPTSSSARDRSAPGR
jgi:hypothetical protein